MEWHLKAIGSIEVEIGLNKENIPEKRLALLELSTLTSLAFIPHIYQEYLYIAISYGFRRIKIFSNSVTKTGAAKKMIKKIGVLCLFLPLV